MAKGEIMQKMTAEEVERREIEFQATQRKFYDALKNFEVPDEKSLKRVQKSFSRCPVPEIEEYFEHVCKYGKPFFNWELIRPAFLWKLELTISEMLCVEIESLTDENRTSVITEKEYYEQRKFILQKANEFDGTPFTFQRLCELITLPSRHYKRTDKFLRALEKCINVVTTITERGDRVTGVEEFPISESPRGIEQPFFVQVDECDTPVEVKIAAARERMNADNGALTSKTDGEEVGGKAPIDVADARSARDMATVAGAAEDGKDEIAANESPKPIAESDEPARKAPKLSSSEGNEDEATKEENESETEVMEH